jgi:hypothetical protein
MILQGLAVRIAMNVRHMVSWVRLTGSKPGLGQAQLDEPI